MSFGEHGLHIIHAAIDGPIATRFGRDERVPRPPSGVIAPEDIADTYWFVHTQSRRDWTFDLDIRAWLEPVHSI